MAYKKYIKKNGKLYGPYTYHSKRVDGKVISEYHGKNESLFKRPEIPKINLSSNLFLIVIGAIFLIAIGLFVYNVSMSNISGNVALDLDTKYSLNENIKGDFTIKLKEGEFIPANSEVKIQTSSYDYVYTLSELVSQNPSTNNFYIEGETITGNGEGYGIPGSINSEEEIEFILEISSKKENKETTQEPSDSQTSPEGENPDEALPDTNLDEEPPSPSQETPSQDSGSPSEEETLIQEGTSEESNQENSPSENSNPEKNQNSENTNSEISQAQENNQESTSEASSEASILETVSNLFLGLTSRGLTGQVSLDIGDEIEGTTSGNKEFKLILEDDQKVSLKKDSVKLKSTGEELNENDIKIEQEGNVVVITSQYSSSQKGYGEEFLSEDYEYDLKINLDNLKVPAQQGVLLISVSYEDVELISASKVLEIDEEIKEQNQTEETLDFETISFDLTQKEKEILLSTFENLSIKITKAESSNNRLNLRYELDKYWIEYSYEFDGDVESVSGLIERDKSRFLKDIANELLKEKVIPVEIENMTGSFDINSIKSFEIKTNTSDISSQEVNDEPQTNQNSDEVIDSNNTESEITDDSISQNESNGSIEVINENNNSAQETDSEIIPTNNSSQETNSGITQNSF